MVEYLSAITRVTDALGVSFENLVLILVLCGCLVFFASSFQLGAMITFLFSSAFFTAFYYLSEAGYSIDLRLSIVMFLGSIVVLALSLYTAAAQQKGGGSFI